MSCAFDGFLKVWNYEYDAETGEMGKVVQQFEHPDEFRCIGYQNATYHLLGGTEQGAFLAIHRSLLPERSSIWCHPMKEKPGMFLWPDKKTRKQSYCRGGSVVGQR